MIINRIKCNISSKIIINKNKNRPSPTKKMVIDFKKEN